MKLVFRHPNGQRLLYLTERSDEGWGQITVRYPDGATEIQKVMQSELEARSHTLRLRLIALGWRLELDE